MANGAKPEFMGESDHHNIIHLVSNAVNI